MTDQVKTLIVERNGTDLEDQEELDLTADNVFLDSPLFVEDNVREALESLKSVNSDNARRWFIQYSLSAQLNFDEYLYPWNYDSSGQKRSGNNSNGWQFFDSSPIVASSIITAFIPMRQFSPKLAPCIIAPCPT